MAPMPSRNPTTPVLDRPQPPRRFRRGDLVEVASEELGFVGSYYEATVVADIGELGYIVQYSHLLREDMLGPLREVATAAEVRPRPPPIATAEYRVNELVDAFDNDGWWWGRITGRVADGYMVFFHTTGEHMSYPGNLLRIHQEFNNGRWTRHY